MRLTCPNCSAEYEVDAQAIPPAGRDVQCSNCGHSWFQPALTQPDEDMYSPPADPPRREVDESVLAVLREEAEREAAARRAERGARPAVETQVEMDIPAPALDARPALGDAPAGRATRPVYDLDGLDEDAGPAPSPSRTDAASLRRRKSPRRDLLPDIEEISSTLSPAMPEDAAQEVARRPSRGPFRAGFFLVLLAAAAGAGVYAAAPQLSARFPAYAPQLDQYVTQVDALRLDLDSAVVRVTALIAEFASHAKAN